MVTNDLGTNSIWDDLTLLLESVEISLDEVCETELSGNHNLLTAWELELGSSESLASVWHIIGGDSHGKENLTDVHSGGFTETLTECTSHSLLESISSGTRQHLVDSDNVPWMNSDSGMEVISSNLGGHVLVASNSGCLKSFRTDLLLLIADQMDAGWEIIMLGSLFTDVVNSQLWVWDTSVESRLWIWLVLLVPKAPSGSSSHFNILKSN